MSMNGWAEPYLSIALANADHVRFKSDSVSRDMGILADAYRNQKNINEDLSKEISEVRQALAEERLYHKEKKMLELDILETKKHSDHLEEMEVRYLDTIRKLEESLEEALAQNKALLEAVKCIDAAVVKHISGKNNNIV